jgi:hypothetical protein
VSELTRTWHTLCVQPLPAAVARVATRTKFGDTFYNSCQETGIGVRNFRRMRV